MTPADLARRLFRDQCNIGPNSTLEAYGETSAVAAMVPLIEALRPFTFEGVPIHIEWDRNANLFTDALTQKSLTIGEVLDARAALTPQPEEVA